jgi:hypothetical protein
MYIYIRDIYTYICIYIYRIYIYNIHFDITMMIKYVRCLDDQDIHLIYFGFSDPHGDPLWDDNPHFFWFMNMGCFFYIKHGKAFTTRHGHFASTK